MWPATNFYSRGTASTPRTARLRATSTPESAYRPGMYLHDHPDSLQDPGSENDEESFLASDYSQEAPFYGFTPRSSGLQYVLPPSVEMGYLGSSHTH